MGRMTEDGRHEGVVIHIFGDGMSGSSWSGGPVATVRADGTDLPTEDWQTRTWEDVVAFRAICTDCSDYRYRQCWQGPVWTRVATADDQDLTQRRLYAPDQYGLDEASEDLIMQAWDQHIAPYAGCWAIEVAAAAVAEAQQRLTDAVREAREQGASWEAIGTAAGMTRQSAHERWSRLETR
ncbi:hypothetical protein NMK54_34400 [Nocardia otitidiscaviarum]|uniref:hypothetical protein n=1 Tax=Nocardia otitidiscaviarum TaxID=1823 RepID=UPI0020CFAE62|nr:hypothetical protein [Nocardia otitidiscaviarum]MCP9625239.1 hypothetical protein [Nocardia otitidiscaviarum]